MNLPSTPAEVAARMALAGAVLADWNRADRSQLSPEELQHWGIRLRTSLAGLLEALNQQDSRSDNGGIYLAYADAATVLDALRDAEQWREARGHPSLATRYGRLMARLGWDK
jgi:hypothetical protein